MSKSLLTMLNADPFHLDELVLICIDLFVDLFFEEDEMFSVVSKALGFKQQCRHEEKELQSNMNLPAAPSGPAWL